MSVSSVSLAGGLTVTPYGVCHLVAYSKTDTPGCPSVGDPDSKARCQPDAIWRVNGISLPENRGSTMKTRQSLALLTLASLLAAVPLGAQENETTADESAPAGDEAAAAGRQQRGPNMSEEQRQAHREAMRQSMQNMTPEEREAHRAAMREKMQRMSPEEREAHRAAMRERMQSMTPEEREAHRAEMRERWEGMSEEERAAMREKRRQHKPGKGDGHGQHGSQGAGQAGGDAGNST